MRPIREYDPDRWVVKVPKFRNVKRCKLFLKKHGHRRLPPYAENVFLKDLQAGIDYACRINSRLPEHFEREIKKDSQLSFNYVLNVIQEPFPEFEDSISQIPTNLVVYAKEVVKGRLSEKLESCLIGDPYSCFEYSWQILDGRLPETLHNFMFCANLDTNISPRYRGCYQRKLDEADEYNPDYSSPKEYFEFIKWQRKNLHRLIEHYRKIYGFDSSRSVGDFLYELENGK